MGRKKLPITGPPSFPIKRGCKKFPHLIGAVSIRAGDLSALRHNRAEVPLLQYRPLPPLEMTIVAGSIQSFQRGTQIEKRCTAYVISTKAERSGEISRPYGTVGMAAGNLGALSHNRAEVPLFQYRPLPPLEMTMVADHLAEKRVIQKAVRNGYAFLHSLFSIEKSSPRGRAFSVLQASAAFAFLVRKY